MRWAWFRHVTEYLGVEGLTVTAVCDVVKDAALKAQAAVERAGHHPPAVYANGERDFENLVKRDDVDFAYIATPWEWHVPMALAAMNGGKHAFVEVPAAATLEDCWKLVDTSEKTRRHCLMMENCCYGYNELLVLNMIRAGLFGDLLYGEGAYLHDLRRLLFEDRSEGLWRRFPHTRHNGNLYPTHGLGPVANYMGVNRGDRFDYLVSMSSPERGLDAWREAHVPKDSPKWKEKYICGDLNTSLIKTANGLVITLQHDVVNPHPYDRTNLIAGVKGIFRDYPPRIYFDDPECRGVHADRQIQRPVRASALEARGRTGAQAGRARRHGLPDGLPADRMHAQGSCAGLRRVRCGRLERAGASERSIGRAGQRAGEVSGFHAGKMEGEAGLAGLVG